METMESDDPMWPKALHKLYALAQQGEMRDGGYRVASTTTDEIYTVTADPDDGRPVACSCKAFRFRQARCKHMEAVDPERVADELVVRWQAENDDYYRMLGEGIVATLHVEGRRTQTVVRERAGLRRR